MSALCTGLYSQPFTGIDTYLHTPRLIGSDGTTTTFNSRGFIIAGYQPAATAANPLNIYIDKTDVDGSIPGAPFFSNEYKFAADNIKPCGGNIVSAVNCYGVSINELQYSTGNEWYNMVASFDRGCLYADLDQNGIPVNSAYFNFPGQVTNVTRPLIASSNIMTGRSYVAGSYYLNGRCQMYLMLVGLGGGLGWPISYMNTAGGELVPSAIIESPYSPSGVPELVVVGTYNIGSSLRRQGFFARFDGTSGAFISMMTYDTPTGSNERCLSVSTAFGTRGFIIGGTTDANAALGTSWMMTVDMFGNLNWSSVIAPSTGINGDVVGTKERFSNAYGQYEYYGTSTANNAMTVIKLDNAGNMFFQPGNTNNEFLYNDNIGGRAVPAAISYLDNGGPNDGIHVYGRDATPVSNLFMARACFNGAAGNAGCTPANITLNALPASYVSPGPNLMARQQITRVAGLTPCTQFGFGGGPTHVNIVAPCDENVLPVGGDQSRPALATGISTVSKDADKFSVSPNPVADKMVISYSSNSGSDATISLTNNLGQLVTPVIAHEAMKGSNEAELDLSRMNLNSGVYFVTVVVDGIKTTKKIVYTK